MIADLRKEFGEVLLVDAGDFFWPQKLGELSAEVTAQALEMMQYDVLNVADGELAFGTGFQDRYTPGLKDKLTSANILKDHKRLWRPYVSKTVHGVKIAVVGVVAPQLVSKMKVREDKIEVEDPEAALKNLVPGLREEADILILLSHAGWERSVQLAERINGIDFMIVGHDYYRTFESETVHNTVLVKSSVGGKHLGEIRVWLDDGRRVKNYETSLRELSSTVKTYPEYTLPESEFERKRLLTIQ